MDNYNGPFKGEEDYYASQKLRHKSFWQRNRWFVISIGFLVILLAIFATSTFYLLTSRTQTTPLNSGNTATTAPVNANTAGTNQATPAVTNAVPTPTIASPSGTTINENRHLTCTSRCTLQVPVTLDTIVVKSSSSTLEMHFTIQNGGTSICTGMHAYPLYLEDPAGKQSQGSSPGTFTEYNDINAGQTFQEYSTFQLAPVAGTAYTLHISLSCGFDGESFQIETFTF